MLGNDTPKKWKMSSRCAYFLPYILFSEFLYIYCDQIVHKLKIGAMNSVYNN